MLILSIIMFGLAVIVSSFTAAGAVGTGAVAFALGFLILAGIAATSHFTHRAA